MSTTPRPPLLSDEEIIDETWVPDMSSWEPAGAYEAGMHWARRYYEAARAKDAELIQQLVDGLQQIADEGHWTPDMHELLNAAAAAGFKPSET